MASFLGTLYKKYCTNMLAVDFAFLELKLSVSGSTIALIDLTSGAYKCVILSTFFTDSSYSIFNTYTMATMLYNIYKS